MPPRAFCIQTIVGRVHKVVFDMPAQTNRAHPVNRVVVRSLVRTGFQRPAASSVEAISRMDVTKLSELVGRMYTMNQTIRPLSLPALPVTGVVTTAKCPPGDNIGLIKALTLVEKGDVLIVDAQGFQEWCLGGFQLLKFARDNRGLAGLIVNGAYRDVSEAQDAGFPVYATAIAPYSGSKAGPCEVNVPICCGGVIVQAGDVVSASNEGIVVIPQRSLQDVIDAIAGANASNNSDENILKIIFDLANGLDCDVVSG